ncbi:hypothetical protein N0V82_001877 [Gnomoniopsis sp. IMI 355080]|nr:hypothetical protein N0V82_001877 [Gnomoniopsis sp. IMI 355080]
MRLPTLAALALLGTAHAITTISAYGNKFFYENGTQFFIKGVAYQLTSDDPLTDSAQCSRDASLMQELGVNTIRVYHVDASSDHDDCMTAFANAGIYLFVDLDTFDTYILPTTPYWNQTQYERFTGVMDGFVKYDNTLGFFVGNEVIAQADQSLAAPYIKAAARDLKAYRNSKGYREVPVGYSAADIAELRPMLQDYLTCGGNASDSIDFFALNSYEWCGDSSYTVSGYANLESEAVNFPVPIFFSETGCNTAGARTFTDQAAIFGENMVNDWSGSIIYEWIQEANDYGLISYGPSAAATATASGVVAGFTRTGTPTPISPDFSNLKAQWATLTPTGVQKSDLDTATLTTRDCPSATSSGWLVSGNVALPSIGQTLDVSATGSAASSTSTSSSSSGSSSGDSKSPAAQNSKVTVLGAGLMAIMILFMVWL